MKKFLILAVFITCGCISINEFSGEGKFPVAPHTGKEYPTSPLPFLTPTPIVMDVINPYENHLS